MDGTFHNQQAKFPTGGTWVPPDQQTPAWKVFHEKFHVRVSSLDMMSIDDLAFFGLPTSGDPVFDRQMRNEKVLRMLSIDQMAELFRRHVAIHLVHFDDAKIIYDIVDDHLKIWRGILERTLNRAAAPVEDLILLDKFCNVVYKSGEVRFNEEIVDSILAKKMSATLRLSRDSFFVENKKTVFGQEMPTEEEQQNTQPERPSMAETFSNYLPPGDRKPLWK